MDRAIVVFRAPNNGICVDLDIPLNISAYELIQALNVTYQLGINISDIKKCYLKADNPIALLMGGKSLADYGIRDGSILVYSE